MGRVTRATQEGESDVGVGLRPGGKVSMRGEVAQGAIWTPRGSWVPGGSWAQGVSRARGARGTHGQARHSSRA